MADKDRDDWVAGLLAGIFVAVIGGGLLVIVLNDVGLLGEFFARPLFDPKGNQFTTVATVVGGGIAVSGLVLLWWRTHIMNRSLRVQTDTLHTQSISLEQQAQTLTLQTIGQEESRFRNAAEMLGHQGVSAQLAGIRMLKEFALDQHARFGPMAVELLSDHARQSCSEVYHACTLASGLVTDAMSFEDRSTQFERRIERGELNTPQSTIGCLNALSDIWEQSGEASQDHPKVVPGIAFIGHIVGPSLKNIHLPRCHVAGASFFGASIQGCVIEFIASRGLEFQYSSVINSTVNVMNPNPYGFVGYGVFQGEHIDVDISALEEKDNSVFFRATQAMLDGGSYSMKRIELDGSSYRFRPPTLISSEIFGALRKIDD